MRFNRVARIAGCGIVALSLATGFLGCAKQRSSTSATPTPTASQSTVTPTQAPTAAPSEAPSPSRSAFTPFLDATAPATPAPAKLAAMIPEKIGDAVRTIAPGVDPNNPTMVTSHYVLIDEAGREILYDVWISPRNPSDSTKTPAEMEALFLATITPDQKPVTYQGVQCVTDTQKNQAAHDVVCAKDLGDTMLIFNGVDSAPDFSHKDLVLSGAVEFFTYAKKAS